MGSSFDWRGEDFCHCLYRNIEFLEVSKNFNPGQNGQPFSWSKNSILTENSGQRALKK